MLSDFLSDAISQIEEWQRDEPGCYDGWRDQIELVKKVLDSLREVLDEPPFAIALWYERLLKDDLTDDDKLRWRVWCEAGIARWVERLRLLEPVSPDELVGKVAEAVERQDAMLNERSDEGRGERRLFLTCLYVWCFLAEIEPLRKQFEGLLRSLESDNEAMPADGCEWLGLPVGSTYADGVGAVRRALEASGRKPGADGGARAMVANSEPPIYLWPEEEHADYLGAFLEWVDLWLSDAGFTEDDVVEFEGGWYPELKNCPDRLPSEYCERLSLPHGSTYAEAVELVRSKLC